MLLLGYAFLSITHVFKCIPAAIMDIAEALKSWPCQILMNLQILLNAYYQQS